MKPLHRIAIVLGVAQVAVLAVAARHRPPHGRPHRSHGCDRADHGPHGHHGHRREHHGPPRHHHEHRDDDAHAATAPADHA